MSQLFEFVLIVAVLLLIDLYIFNAVRTLSGRLAFFKKKWFAKFYWTCSILLIIALLLSVFADVGVGIRAASLLAFSLLFIGKISFLPFLFIDDARRLWVKLSRRKAIAQPLAPAVPKPDAIPRSEFLVKAGLLAGAIPLGGIMATMTNGLYDYHVKYQTLYLPNLPKAFDGLRIGQISDIHSGSFYDKKAVIGGVDMLLREKTDLIFFTGDLVNTLSNEMIDYQDIFSKIKAPLGVFSIFGNHDYGDYAYFATPAEKKKNLDDLKTTHKNMGWDLLLNEHRRLKVNGEEIGILGIENWGALSRFPKYGRMDLAVKNTEDLPVKLLLSHDPSHWRAQVLPEYPQIDAMFSGHTHGMQFGVQTDTFQWSPIEYVYKEWAGHYQEGKQQLYVNVGYGFLGYSGRVGILPEITIFTLKAASAPIT